MKRFATVILMVAVILAPCLAMAGATDVETVWPGKWYFGADHGTATDFDRLPGGTWPGLYLGSLPPPPSITLVAGDVLVIGMDNIRVTKNKKYMTLEFTYTSPGNGALKFTAPGDAHMGSPNSSFALMKETTTTVGANKVYHLEYLIIPQPNWEWIRVHNTGTGPTGTVTITKTTWNAKCWPIPSLTPYGLMLLVLLLAGTAAWVIRRRSAVVSV